MQVIDRGDFCFTFDMVDETRVKIQRNPRELRMSSMELKSTGKPISVGF